MVGWHHRLDGHEFSKLRELMMDREAWRAVVHGEVCYKKEILLILG